MSKETFDAHFAGLSPDDVTRKLLSIRLYDIAAKRGISHAALRDSLKHLYGPECLSTRDMSADDMANLRKFLVCMPLVSVLRSQMEQVVRYEADSKQKELMASAPVVVKKKKKIMRGIVPIAPNVKEAQCRMDKSASRS